MRRAALGISDFRAKAAELRDEAKRVTRPDVREQLLLMAADWEMLARDAEELQRRRRRPGNGPSAPKGS